MLPARQRLTRAVDFAATVRNGSRVARPRVVVHARQARESTSVPDATVPDAGVRVGLVVSKAVGSAVVRHRVSRRLRHVIAPVLTAVPAGTDLVLRALPLAATSSSAELGADVHSALVRLRLLGGSR